MDYFILLSMLPEFLFLLKIFALLIVSLKLIKYACDLWPPNYMEDAPWGSKFSNVTWWNELLSQTEEGILWQFGWVQFSSPVQWIETASTCLQHWSSSCQLIK